MKTSIATVSLSGTLREKLTAISEAGFDGVEILEQDFIASDLSPHELATMVKDHGLKITLFHPFRDFESLPEPLRSRAFTRARRKFELMNEMGADLILFCSTVHPAALGGMERMAEDYHALGEMAQSFGIKVGFEALAWGRFIFDHRDAWEVVRRADHAHIGLILDSFHTLARGIETDSIRRIPKDKIFFVQLSDAPGIEMDLMHWARHYRNMPGEGDLDVTGFTRAVVATGYNGYFSLEILNDLYRAGLARPIAQDGYRSLVALLDQVRRTEPALRVDLPYFPPPQSVDHIEFIEFATTPSEVNELEAQLRLLGFEYSGQHKSKNVRVWRQGDINLLVNLEAQSFARSSYTVHGTAVAEIALKVADAKAAVERAKALHINRFQQANVEGQLAIPALRGVSGSLIRLVDDAEPLGRLWDIDFSVTTPKPSAGLASIDHISQTIEADDMPGWVLFYSTLFDAQKSSLVDVVDPDGLVKSQALHSGGFRVTLNGTDAKRTLAGRFVEETFGASVQHIAFRTDDIFATAAALKALGFEALEIGNNYFEDVEARFGLDPTLTAQLRAFNILYDEDADGSFYQFYSKGHPDRFFFEIVERNGQYQGYGAPNAPYRTAAQKRLLRPDTIPQR